MKTKRKIGDKPRHSLFLISWAKRVHFDEAEKLRCTLGFCLILSGCGEYDCGTPKVQENVLAEWRNVYLTRWSDTDKVFDLDKSEFDMTTSLISRDEFSITCAGMVDVTWWRRDYDRLMDRPMNIKVRWKTYPTDKSGYMSEVELKDR